MPHLNMHNIYWLVLVYVVLVIVIPILYDRKKHPDKPTIVRHPDMDAYVRCEGQRMADMLRNRQRGVAGILEMLIISAIAMIMLAVALPNVAKIVNANQQNQAWVVLTEINRSQGYYNRVFLNGYAAPATLSGNGAVGSRTCDNPQVLGANYSAPFAAAFSSGYVFAFTPGSAISPAGSGCTNAGFQTYTITANPTTAGRYYFFTDQTGVVRFNASQQATASDAVLNW